jgi:hypothetical protein
MEMIITTNDLELLEEEVVLPPKKAAEHYYRNLQQQKKSWSPISNCWTVEISVMFPRSHTQELGVASTICKNCPAMPECLHMALVRKEEYGVWGGHSSRQIEKIIKEINSEFGDIWLYWNENSNEIILNKVKELISEYNIKFNINTKEIDVLKLERKSTLHERLSELKLQ